MKMFYEDPAVEVMLLDVVDVITASFVDGESEEENYSFGIDVSGIQK